MTLTTTITAPKPYRMKADKTHAVSFNILFSIDDRPMFLECGWRLQWGRIMPPSRPVGKRGDYLPMCAVGVEVQRAVYEAVRNMGDWWNQYPDLPPLKSFGSAMVDSVLDENVLERQGLRITI